MKNSLLVIMVMTLVSMLLFAGCSAPAPAPAAPAPKPAAPAAAPPAQAAKTGTINLNIGYSAPSGSSMEKNSFLPWIKLIEQKTNGAVKLTPFPNQTLFKAQDSFNGLKGGIGDIASIPFSSYANQFNLSKVVELPLLNISSAEQGSEILETLFEKYPEMRAEFPDGVKILFIHAGDGHSLFTSKKPVRNLDDIKGMKLRTMPDPQAELFKRLGVTPLTVNTADIYEGIQKGVMDGVAINWGSVEAYRLYEVNKYNTDVILGRAQHIMAISLSKWNSLPPDVQKAIESVSGVFGAKFFGREHFDKAKELVLERMKKGNYEMQTIKLDQGQWEKWQEIAKPLWDKWITERNAEKKPGTQIFNDTIKLSSNK